MGAFRPLFAPFVTDRYLEDLWNELQRRLKWAFAAPLAKHANTHATGGTDELTVEAVAPAITPVRVGMSESLHNVNADSRPMGTIDQSAANAAPVSQTAHIRNMNVEFTAGWSGGTVTVVGLDTFGDPISEEHAKPPGGGTSLGVKPFQLVTGYVNSAPAGAPGTVATVTNGILLGVSHYPVAHFTKASYDGSQRDFTETDTAWGTSATTTSRCGTPSSLRQARHPTRTRSRPDGEACSYPSFDRCLLR